MKESTYKRDLNQTKQTNKQNTTNKIKKKDHLNDWEFCNPTKQNDNLPQPFRFIDKLINELILSPVYSKVFEIEKSKNDSNYDANLKSEIASGSFEITGVSCMNSNDFNSHNQLIVGDKFGNVSILDLDKKSISFKKLVNPGRRVTNISSSTIHNEDGQITTFSVISRAVKQVKIFRYNHEDNVFYHNFTINCAQNIDMNNPQSEISDFPCESKISDDGKYIAVTFYNGSTKIYVIPEPLTSSDLQNLPIEEETQFVKLQQVKKTQESSEYVQTKNHKKTLGQPPKDIQDVYYDIPLKSPMSQLSPQQVIDQYVKQRSGQTQVVEPEVKKDAKGKVIVDSTPQEEVPKPQIMKNKVQLLGELKESDQDINPNYDIPQYRADIFFTKENIAISDDKRVYKQLQNITLTTGVIAIWHETTFFEIHSLQECLFRNVPRYLLKKENQDENDSKSRTQSQTDEDTHTNILRIINENYKFTPKFIKSINVLYSINTSQMNSSSTFLAVGLIDGSVMMFDVLLRTEIQYLDKHPLRVNNIRFTSEYIVVSGSDDGSVYGYNLQEQKQIFKRTNQFRAKNNKIIGLEVAKSRVGFAIDIQNQVRLYDLQNGQKLLRLEPNIPGDQGKLNWFQDEFHKPVMNCQKGQLCILIKKSEDNQNPWEQKTQIAIYRIFDNLINIYPGLANMYRKGYSKDQVLNAFTRLTLQDVINPNFEINIFQPEVTNSKSPSKSPYKKQNTLKSQQLSTITSSKDMSILSDINIVKSKAQKQEGLTKEMLNPQKFLVNSIDNDAPQLFNNLKHTIEGSKLRNTTKEQRAQNTNADIVKIGAKLQAQDELNALNKKKKMMQQKQKV